MRLCSRTVTADAKGSMADGPPFLAARGGAIPAGRARRCTGVRPPQRKSPPAGAQASARRGAGARPPVHRRPPAAAQEPARRSAGALPERRSACTIPDVSLEERARAALHRLHRGRAALRDASWRELQDEHAMRIVLATVLRADSNAIDIGANVGGVLSEIARIAPHGHHLAYEPIPALHGRLQERFPQIEVRRAALSDVTGTADFAHVLGAPAYSGLRRRADLPTGSGEVQTISVQTERLDDSLPSGYVPALLKIDVEGAELQVLRGASETLHRHRPCVLFEHGIGGADLYGSRSSELFDLLDDCGLRIFDLDGEGPYSRERFDAAFSEPIWNYLAVPRA